MIEDKDSFKVCSLCGTEWPGLVEFLVDQDLVVNGYQAHFKRPEDGLFLVTHECEGCGSTLAIKAENFRDLYTGPLYTHRMTGEPACPGRCLRLDDLEPCPNECSMRWVRDVIQTLKNKGAAVDRFTKDNRPVEEP